MNQSPLPYSAELKRKAFHLPALALPIGLLVVGRPAALRILVAVALIALMADVARQRIGWAHRLVLGMFRSLMRPGELPQLGAPLVLNGATWMCLGAALCAFLYPEPIAAAALIMLIFGDAAAALVGRRFGKHRFRDSSKSWEGSIAFLAAAVFVSLPLTQTDLINSLGYPPLSILQVGVGALVSAAVEALPVPFNDNVRVPLLAGLAVMLV